MINPHIVRKTTNPTSAPPEAGIHWINTVTNEEYFSVGTSSINDWLKRGTINYADALQTTCYNNTGVTIPAFSVVYINGSQGTIPTIALSQANNEGNSSKTYGVTSSSIPNNGQGTVIAFGLLQNVNTNAYPQGSALWLSPTIPGGVTTTKPSSPDHMVFIGNVTRSHPTLGRVEIKIQNGFELDELHNVSALSPIDGQTIRFNSTSNLWEKHTLVKGDVGLGNVDNTSDLDKPISNDTQDALDNKVSKPGDTMTGNLEMSDGTDSLILSSDGIDSSKNINIKTNDDLSNPTKDIFIKTGSTSGSNYAGSIYLDGGQSEDGNPANIQLKAGVSVGTGANGSVILDAKNIVYLNQNPSGGITASNHRIENVGDPVSDQDAVTRKWIQDETLLVGTLFVSPSASIFGANGSLLKPFNTIADALAVASDGDTIFLLHGFYNEPTVVIPSSFATLSIIAQSQNSVTVNNGFSYNAPASSISINFEKINLNSFSVDFTSALNGVVNLKQCGLNLNRTDSNNNVLVIASESTFFGGELDGGANNLTECLILSQIEVNGGLVITENCKYVSNFDCYGQSTLRVLDCELFGASSFMNGNIVGANTPLLEIDVASDYFGSFTGNANKTLLANFNSFPFAYPITTENIVISQNDIDNKMVTLANAPVVPSSVTLMFLDGIHQINGIDFSVSGDELSWDSLGLDGFIELGDTIVIQY